ncbi:unnamed protein product [Eretmochelys imbricata]
MTPGPLLWTLALIAGCRAQGLWVSQPSSVQGTEGSSVTLPCAYNSTREPRLGSYTWVKEVAGARLELSNETQEFRGRVSRARDRSFLRERRADVELRDLRPYDAGTYRCLVKIPTVGAGAGNGTWLQVLKPARSVPMDVKPDRFVLLWLFLRGLICIFGLAAGAMGTSLFYQTKLSRRRQRRVRELQAKAQL